MYHPSGHSLPTTPINTGGIWQTTTPTQTLAQLFTTFARWTCIVAIGSPPIKMYTTSRTPGRAGPGRPAGPAEGGGEEMCTGKRCGEIEMYADTGYGKMLTYAEHSYGTI